MTCSMRGSADDDFGMLGMAAGVSRLYREALAESAGIILIAGAAGSGRSTTVEAGLARRADALALEIDDRAGAEAAIDTALSGRLVLAAIRASDSVGAIARLRAMKVEPFPIASTVRAAIGQRLVKRLCSDCRAPVQAAGSLSALLGFDPGTLVHEPRGCASCAGDGYRGMIGLFEGFALDGAIRRLTGLGGDEAVIASHAFRDRPNLAGAARAMVREGLISADEAVRASRTPLLEAC